MHPLPYQEAANLRLRHVTLLPTDPHPALEVQNARHLTLDNTRGADPRRVRGDRSRDIRLVDTAATAGPA